VNGGLARRLRIFQATFSNQNYTAMKLLSEILIGFVALEHIYILWLEMFAWTTKGRKTFKSFPAELFEKTKGMAANQGLYNGFLAAGLIWSLYITDVAWSGYVAYFFLGCVIIAGVYGAASVQKSIFYIQACPAIIALIVTVLLNT
jgi:putative membrane protein